MIPVLHGVWASGGLAGDFEHIETQTVGSGGATSVTFSSIPGTYKHLQVRCILRDNDVQTDGNPIYVRLNGSTSGYAYHGLEGNGTSAYSFSGTSQDRMYFSRACSNGATASVFGVLVLDILDYTSTTKNKTVRGIGGFDGNAAGSKIALGSGLWANTSAVTSVTFLPQHSPSQYSWVQHSTFSLYGIR